MRIFYKTLLCFSAVLITLVSCSFDEMGDQFTLENTKINIAFDREKFDFQKLHEINELSPIKIGDSLMVDAVLDSHQVSFEDLRLAAITQTRTINWPFTAIPANTAIPHMVFSDSINNVEGINPKFEWARIDTGSITVSLKNEMLALDSLVVVVYNGFISGQDPKLIKINTGYFPIDPNLKRFTRPLNGKFLKRGMKVKMTAYTKDGTTTSDELNQSDYLYADFSMSSCAIDSARADFDTQKIVDDSLYVVNLDNISEAREIVTKEATIQINVKNKTGFLLDMKVGIDSLYDLRTHSYIPTKPLVLSPGVTDSLPNGIPIDSCRIKLIKNSVNEDAVYIRSTTYCKSDSSGVPWVTYRKSQKAWLYVSISKTNTKKEPFSAYWVDGKMDHKALDINKEAKAVSGDIDWSDFEGINADSLQAKLNLNVGRDDLKLQEIKFEEFKIQGRKTLANGGTQSAWYPLTIPTMTNVNDTSVFIAGLENVINFHPDTLVYSGKAITTFDGKLYDYDSINIDLGFGVPLQVQATVPAGQVALTQSADVDSLDAINDNEDINIEAVKIGLDAFINNPKAIDAKMRLTVKISDHIVKTFDAENDSLVGNVDTLMTAILQKDYNGSTSYMISNLQGGKPVELKKEAITQMLKNKTYIQQTLEVISQGPGHPIIMKPSDFIEVQLKLSGDLNITFETK